MSRRNCFLSREVCLRRRSRHPVRHGLGHRNSRRHIVAHGHVGLRHSRRNVVGHRNAARRRHVVGRRNRARQRHVVGRRRHVVGRLRGLARAKPHVPRQVVAEVNLGVGTQRLDLLNLSVAADLVELAHLHRLTSQALGVSHGEGTDLFSLCSGEHTHLVSLRHRLDTSCLRFCLGLIDHDLVLDVLLREFGLRDHDELLVLHLLSSDLSLEVGRLNLSFGLLLDSDTKGCLLHESLLRLLLCELQALLPDHIRNNDVGDAHPVDRDTGVNFADLSLDFGHQVVVEVAEVSDLDLIDRAVCAQLAHVLAKRVKNQYGVVVEAILDDRLNDFLRVDAVCDLDTRNVDVDALLRNAAYVVRDVRVLNGLDMVDDRGQRVVELDARVHLRVNLAPVHVQADVAARDGRVERVGRRDGRKRQRAHQRECRDAGVGALDGRQR